MTPIVAWTTQSQASDVCHGADGECVVEGSLLVWFHGKQPMPLEWHLALCWPGIVAGDVERSAAVIRPTVGRRYILTLTVTDQ